MNCENLNQIEGLQFMPIHADKKPIFNGWQRTAKKYDLTNVEAVGLVCGKLSGNLEVIDFDLKYDLTGTLMTRYKDLVNEYSPDLLDKLVWQKTRSNGFHALYRCEKIEGNQQLAQRDGIDSEKDKVLVLIETRGEGGQIVIAPTIDYRLVKGTLESIPTITLSERETLLQCARNFNEHFVPQYNHQVKKMIFDGKSPLDDYDQRGDCVSLLSKHGWTVVGEKGGKILLKRPGSTEAAHSGNFDRDRNWFSVFSTSTEFEAQSPYKPSAVYAMLECNGDYHEAAKRLVSEGYGEKKQSIEIKEKVKVVVGDSNLDYVATEADMEKEMQQWREGTFPLGLSWGIPELDIFHRLKRGTVNPVNGHDNVGKSVILWWLATVSTLYHNWNWVIFSSENKFTTVKKRMIEFYWGESIRGMNDQKYREANKWFHKHFRLIKCTELYSYRDVLNMTENIASTMKIDGLLIDPWNSLKRETFNGKISVHDYDYDASSDMKNWSANKDITIYVNCHAVTNAMRQKDAQGNPAAPMKADTEGGSKWSSKADDFLTIHRLVYDDIEYKKTQIYVRKVKETETGGRNSPLTEPVILEMVNQVKFVSKSGVDPIAIWRSRATQTEIVTSSVTPAASSFSRNSSQDVKEAAEPHTPTQAELLDPNSEYYYDQAPR